MVTTVPYQLRSSQAGRASASAGAAATCGAG